MSDSCGSYFCQVMTQETVQEDPDDPGPRRFRLAVRDVNGRFFLPG
jgi:hypothetical protein